MTSLYLAFNFIELCVQNVIYIYVYISTIIIHCYRSIKRYFQINIKKQISLKETECLLFTLNETTFRLSQMLYQYICCIFCSLLSILFLKQFHSHRLLNSDCFVCKVIISTLFFSTFVYYVSACHMPFIKRCSFSDETLFKYNYANLTCFANKCNFNPLWHVDGFVLSISNIND